MPESVLAGLLAPGSFDGVAVTAEGPPLAFTSRADQGANVGQAWALAWDAATAAPSHRVKVPAPVNDLALSTDGTLPATTEDGLYSARIVP